MVLFLNKLNPTDEDLVLDLGVGSGLYFEEKYYRKKNSIALDLDWELLSEARQKCPEIMYVGADALSLPFKDKSVPIIFSNAVIEHVGNFEKQKKYADEINRVARKYFVTTPNKYFPLEFHYMIPLYQFVPKRVQRWLCRNFGIGLWYYKGVWEDINLLSSRQFKRLFPTAVLVKQRITIYPETLICFKA